MAQVARRHAEHRRRHVRRAPDGLPDIGRPTSSASRRRRRWCSRATSSPASSPTKGLKPISGLQRVPVPVDQRLAAGGRDAAATPSSMFKDSPAARALVTYLATPEAATIWAKRGGFSSPNKNVPPSAYPDALDARDPRRRSSPPRPPGSTCPTCSRRRSAAPRPGRVEDLPGLPEEPEQRQRDRVGARDGGGEGVQEAERERGEHHGGAPGATGAPPAAGGPGRWPATPSRPRFLAPALILLGVWIVYPTIYTIVRSFFDRADGDFVGIDNYKALFTTPDDHDRDQEQRDLGRRRAGARHRDRARSSRC